MKTRERNRTPVEQETPRRFKKRKVAKVRPYRIVGRYIGPDNGLISQLLGRDWKPWGAYETKRARDDAFRALQAKGGLFGPEYHEYRIVEPEQ